MKLVDILARELKEWPKSADSLAQSFGGMVFYISSVVQLKTLFRTEVSEDWREAMVFKPQWQAAVDALKAEKVVEWNGDGLPPVGSVCGAEISEGVWAESKVIYHHPYQSWRAAIAYGSGPDILGWATKFRPIRTPEQIAVEERESIIKEMQVDLPGWILKGDYGHIETVCAMLHDAGYRKLGIVDN